MVLIWMIELGYESFLWKLSRDEDFRTERLIGDDILKGSGHSGNTNKHKNIIIRQCC